MGQRRKTGDSTRLPAISRRVVIGASAVLPLAGPARGAAPVMAADIPAQCASWVALDLEIAVSRDAGQSWRPWQPVNSTTSS